MYPSSFFHAFPPFPREQKIFVAMSFEERFQKRWEDVIRAGILSIEVNGKALEAHRVDIRRVSDSIVTEILQGISQYLLVLADVTTIGHVGDRPIRNANVLYEVGIAHAIRLPEEVLLFRSDSDPLIFDVANIRVLSYDPDNDPVSARNLVSETVISALREVELRRHFAVDRAVQSLDFNSCMVLVEAARPEGIEHPVMRTMRDVMSATDRIRAISRLLDFGAIKTEYRRVTPETLHLTHSGSAEEMVQYKATPFGAAIIAEMGHRQGLLSPDMQQSLQELSEELEEPIEKSDDGEHSV